MARPRGTRAARAVDSQGTYFVRITVSGLNWDDIRSWEDSLSTYTGGHIVPANSVIGYEDKSQRDAGYFMGPMDTNRGERHILRFLISASTGTKHAEFMKRSDQDLLADRIVRAESEDGTAFIVPMKIDVIEKFLHGLRAQQWWTFGSSDRPVKPIVTYIESKAAETNEWFDYALSDPGLFGAAVGPQHLSPEQFAVIVQEPYGLEHLGPDFLKYVKEKTEEAILEEGEDAVFEKPFVRTEEDTERLPVRLRSGFLSKLIKGYKDLTQEQKSAISRDPEKARPWEYWVRDQERYPEDQGRMYWDVLGLPRGDSKESTNPTSYRKVRTAWTNSTEYGRQYHIRWNQSDKNQKVQERYDTSVKGRERKQAYKQSEGGRAASKLYQKRKRVRDKIFRTLYLEIHPITDQKWTEVQIDYYIWDNYGDQLLREQWVKGEDFFIRGPDTTSTPKSMEGKYGLEHIRPSRIGPEDLDYSDGYTNPEIEDEE
jgi:hypothetical protein